MFVPIEHDRLHVIIGAYCKKTAPRVFQCEPPMFARTVCRTAHGQHTSSRQFTNEASLGP